MPISSSSFSKGTTHVRPNATKFDGGNHPRIASFNVVLFFSRIGYVDYIFVC